MDNGSFALGRLGGIRLKAHWSAGLIALLVFASLGRVIGPGPALLGTVGFLASILLHELGHALTARRFGVPTESIQLWALGGVARLEREAPTPKAEGWIAAAGPLTSVALGVASIGAWFALGGRDASSHSISVLAWLGMEPA